MNELEEIIQRELTVPENLIKAVGGAIAAFLAKKVVEDAIEAGIRHRNP